MRRLRLWLVLLAVALLWPGVGPGDPVVASAAVGPGSGSTGRGPAAATTAAADPRVERARARLDAARADEAATTAELDRAAAEYERVRAHAQRLADEAAASGRTVADARSVAAHAASKVRERVLLLFTHPDLRSSMLSPAILGADVGETLHRVELVEQLTRRSARERGRADRALARVRHAEREYRLVASGVDAAVRDRRQRAERLIDALSAARRRVDGARQHVREVEDTVAVERAARRRALARRRLQAAATGGGAPLPAVDGKVCPIGAPNAFSDTWGAPRSGGRTHQGVDIFAAYGTALHAIGDGTVRITNSVLGGLSIHLTTVDGDRYYYAHLSQTAVSGGQRVAAGQTVGAVGNSGNARSTPAHLHWQYHPGGGAAVNPYALAVALCRA